MLPSLYFGVNKRHISWQSPIFLMYVKHKCHIIVWGLINLALAVFLGNILWRPVCFEGLYYKENPCYNFAQSRLMVIWVLPPFNLSISSVNHAVSEYQFVPFTKRMILSPFPQNKRHINIVVIPAVCTCIKPSVLYKLLLRIMFCCFTRDRLFSATQCSQNWAETRS